MADQQHSSSFDPTDQSPDSPKSTALPHLPHRQKSHASQPHKDKQSTTAGLGTIKPPHQLEVEDIDLGALPPASHPGRTAAASIMAIAILIGLAATWFHFNQNVYSLDGLGGQTAANITPTPSTNPSTLGAEINQTKTLSLNLSLPELSQGHYQAWIHHQDQDISLGAFKPSGQSIQNMDGSPFNPTTTYAANDNIFITIEAGDVLAVTPSTTVILTGTIDDQGQAKLAFKAIDLSQASGSFTLATPTDSDTDPTSGIWFAKADGDNLGAPSLTLPNAPAGWKYEGQVVYKDVAVEVGRFSQADKADEFNKFTPNPDRTPNVPGEDFLQKAPGQLGLDFPTSLATGEWKVVISLEPDQDGQDPTGDNPFYLQPLKADIPQDAKAHKDYPLTLDISTFPTGTATFK